MAYSCELSIIFYSWFHISRNFVDNEGIKVRHQILTLKIKAQLNFS